MSDYPDYQSSLERGGNRTTGNQPQGVSQSDKEKNEGWSHRRSMCFGDDIQRGASTEYNERMHGEVHYRIEEEEDKQSLPDQKSREERLPDEVYRLEEKMKLAARARKNYSQHWSESTREASRWNFHERRQQLVELCEKHGVEPTIL
jgi:hypothetical protein